MCCKAAPHQHAHVGPTTPKCCGGAAVSPKPNRESRSQRQIQNPQQPESNPPGEIHAAQRQGRRRRKRAIGLDPCPVARLPRAPRDEERGGVGSCSCTFGVSIHGAADGRGGSAAWRRCDVATLALRSDRALTLLHVDSEVCGSPALSVSCWVADRVVNYLDLATSIVIPVRGLRVLWLCALPGVWSLGDLENSSK